MGFRENYLRRVTSSPLWRPCPSAHGGIFMDGEDLGRRRQGHCLEQACPLGDRSFSERLGCAVDRRPVAEG